jgi:hypothetical protein
MLYSVGGFKCPTLYVQIGVFGLLRELLGIKRKVTPKRICYLDPFRKNIKK